MSTIVDCLNWQTSHTVYKTNLMSTIVDAIIFFECHIVYKTNLMSTIVDIEKILKMSFINK